MERLVAQCTRKLRVGLYFFWLRRPVARPAASQLSLKHLRVYSKYPETERPSCKPRGQELSPEKLDIEFCVTIIHRFFMSRRLMTIPRPSETSRGTRRLPKILRAKFHAGAKSTPNTPYTFQETT